MTIFNLDNGIADKIAPILPADGSFLPSVSFLMSPALSVPSSRPPDTGSWMLAWSSALGHDDVVAVPTVPLPEDPEMESRKSDRGFRLSERDRRMDLRWCKLSKDFLVLSIFEDTAPFPPT